MKNFAALAFLALQPIAQTTPILAAAHQLDLSATTPAASLVHIEDIADAYSQSTWTVTLSGGFDYRIVLDGDGDTDLDVYVYDEFGNLIDSDTDLTDYCIVHAAPAWTGPFTIEIVNLGSMWNRYVLTID